MTQQVSNSIPGTVGQVINVITSRDFAEFNTQQAGGTLKDFSVDGDKNSSFTLTSTREVPTTFLPDIAKKVLGGSMTLIQQEDWSAPQGSGDRQGKTTITISGMPISVNGIQSLTQQAPDTVNYQFEGGVKASIPLLGKKIEAAAEPRFVDVMKLQAQAIADWISNHPETAE